MGGSENSAVNKARVKYSGFTLIEVMLAMGIVAIVMAAFLQILMSVHRSNTAIAASITANSAIRSLADEALAVATENAHRFDGNFARAFVNHYGASLPALDLPIGPNGSNVPRIRREFINNRLALTYTFAVPEPGSFSRYVSTQPWSNGAADGQLIPYQYGIGQMVIYLNESGMPAGNLDGSLSSEAPAVNGGGQPVMWITEGARNGEPGDGILQNAPGVVISGTADLVNPPQGLNRIFADITVTYFEDAAHTRTLAVNERRILIIGSLNTQELFG